MSNQGDFTGRNELDEFVKEVHNLLDRPRFRGLEQAGVKILVPEDAAQAEQSEVMARARAEGVGAESTAAGGCNCPSGQHCVRLFPGGRRVCVPD